ncbi:hypothetical protein BJ508DRAFT_198210, partial [Ascobolus immersus RN42]
RIHPVFHVSRLKLRPTKPSTDGTGPLVRPHQHTPPPLRVTKGLPEYEVETILSHSVINGKRHYRVRWRDHEGSDTQETD